MIHGRVTATISKFSAQMFETYFSATDFNSEHDQTETEIVILAANR